MKLTDEELATPKPPRTKAEGGKGADSKGSNSKAAVQPAVQPTSSDLKDLLENVGPDELATALALADWDNEQLKELVKILSSRLTGC